MNDYCKIMQKLHLLLHLAQFNDTSCLSSISVDINTLHILYTFTYCLASCTCMQVYIQQLGQRRLGEHKVEHIISSCSGEHPA